MKSNYKKLMTEGVYFQAPKSSVIRINSTKDAFDFLFILLYFPPTAFQAK